MAELTIGSLCSGYGGLTLAVLAALGGRVAWHSEIEPAADRVLSARFPGVPNIGDMTKVDWSSVEPVDVLEGGTPCQDVSHAGRRAGMRTGTRSGLWSSMVDAIDVLRPRLVVWENVRGVLSAAADSDLEPCPVCVGDGSGDALRALGRVLGDLADSGYDARWCGLRASDVGAPHPRFRVFVAAHPADIGHERGGPAWGRGTGSADSGQPVAYPDSDPVREQPVTIAGRGGTAVAGLSGQANAYSDDGCRDRGQREQVRDEIGRAPVTGGGASGVEWGPYAPAVERWEYATGRPAPAPTDPGTRGGQRLAPRFVEWMMGLPAGWVTDVPGISRNDKLKMLGNGVVPQQAAAAITYLMGES